MIFSCKQRNCVEFCADDQEMFPKMYLYKVVKGSRCQHRSNASIVPNLATNVSEF